MESEARVREMKQDQHTWNDGEVLRLKALPINYGLEKIPSESQSKHHTDWGRESASASGESGSHPGTCRRESSRK